MPELPAERFRESGRGIAPERRTEGMPERSAERRYERTSESSAREGIASPVIPPRTASMPVPDPELHAVESILAEGLDETFLRLSPVQQAEFKRTGEVTARKILDALRKKATRIKDIVRLIIGWLKTLPGINIFFLEQEAKIKADKMYDRYRKP